MTTSELLDIVGIFSTEPEAGRHVLNGRDIVNISVLGAAGLRTFLQLDSMHLFTARQHRNS